ncbi:hypothetical protein BHM03_00044165 [Ensete ventricosum]|nr:hypothetical protein BHM03_00044165 [Ensete ventricosum]
MGVRLSRPTTRLLSCASHPRSPQPPRLAPVYRAVPLPDLPLRGRGAIYYGAVRFFVCECVTSRADSMLNEQNGRGTCESAASFDETVDYQYDPLGKRRCVKGRPRLSWWLESPRLLTSLLG